MKTHSVSTFAFVIVVLLLPFQKLLSQSSDQEKYFCEFYDYSDINNQTYAYTFDFSKMYEAESGMFFFEKPELSLTIFDNNVNGKKLSSTGKYSVFNLKVTNGRLTNNISDITYLIDVELVLSSKNDYLPSSFPRKFTIGFNTSSLEEIGDGEIFQLDNKLNKIRTFTISAKDVD